MDSLNEGSVGEILESWSGFMACTETLIRGHGDLSVGRQLSPFVATLCKHGLSPLPHEHFLHSLQETFKSNAVFKFWEQFDSYGDAQVLDSSRFQSHEEWHQVVLSRSLEERCSEKSYLEKCLLVLVHALQSYEESIANNKMEFQHLESNLTSRYQLMILRLSFKKKLEELSTLMNGNYEDRSQVNDHDFDNVSKSSPGIGEMDIDGSYHTEALSSNNSLIKNIGKVVRDLRSLGFTSLIEDAYASAIFLLLKNKVHSLAGDEYRSPVLGSVKEWIRYPFDQCTFQMTLSWHNLEMFQKLQCAQDLMQLKGILVESVGAESDDHIFTLVDDMMDTNRKGIVSGSCEPADEEGERSVASVEEQLRREMTIYEKFIEGMLINFGSLTLDRIHNSLKMFCSAEPSYDKPLQQLQSFLSSLI